MRVLLVEDEERFAETIARGLRRHGYSVDIANDGLSGWEKATLNDYDVVVLDRDLPGLHGDEVCRRLHQSQTRARILMLTAASSSQDLVEGLGLGADDYLGKPFDFDVLVARIQALARRVAAPTAIVLRAGNVEVDTRRHQATRNGQVLALTARELAVLTVLLQADGNVVSAEELLEKAWDEHADPFTASVRVIMSRLRAKLGEPAVIETVVGRGYQVPR